MRTHFCRAAFVLLALMLLAGPAAAEARIFPCQDVEILLPREWIALETTEGSLFRPINDARFGGGARVMVCSAERIADFDAMEAMAYAYSHATLLKTVEEEGELLAQLTAGGHPYLYQELRISDPVTGEAEYVGFLVCQPRAGVPMVVEFRAPEVEGFLWAAFLAGIFIESAHTDLARLDLTNFDLPLSLDLDAAASE